MTFKEPNTAFQEAIASGRLSAFPETCNYAGDYMYMGTDATGKDLFKKITTRRYDV